MKQKEVPEMDDVAEIISKISEDSPYKRRPTQKRTWMTVPEMGKLLGLKKTDRYWLVHKNVFESKEIAGKIYERHRFFTDRLIEAGVDPKTAEADACRIEHVISEESFEQIKQYVADHAQKRK